MPKLEGIKRVLVRLLSDRRPSLTMREHRHAVL